MTAGVNANYYNQYQQYPQYNQNQAIYGQQAVYAQQTPYAQQTGFYGQNQVAFGHEPANTQAQNTTQPVEDGEDDGKIGVLRATGNAIAGIGKFFTGMFCDENGVSPLQIAKTAVIMAGFGVLCALTAGTAVPAILLTAGMMHTGLGAAKSAYDMYTADTDAEMIAASESFGSNMTGFALTLLGARALKGNPGSKMSKVESFSKSKGIRGNAKVLWNKTTAFGKESWNGVKETFKDAWKPVSESYTAARSGYSSSEGIIDNVKNVSKSFSENVKTQWKGADGKSGFKGKVSENYKNIINAKNSVAEDIEALNNKIEKLKNKNEKLIDELSKENEKVAQNRDKNKINALNKEIAKNNKKLDKLDGEKTGMKNMNEVSTWEEGNKQVSETQAQLNKAKADLETATKNANPCEINDAQVNVDKLEAQLKAEKDVLARRTQEAQSIRDQIAAKKKELKELKKDPNENNVAINKLQDELNALNEKEGANFLPNRLSSNLIELYKDQIKYAKIANGYEESVKANRLNQLKQNLEKAKMQNEAATGGGVKTHNINSFKRQIIKDHLNIKNSTPWITVGISGRNNQTNLEAEFYSMIDPEYKNYVKTLNKQQKDALLRKFQQEIA